MSSASINNKEATSDDRAIDTYAEYYVETLARNVLNSENIKTWVQEFDLFPDEPTWTLANKIAEVKNHLKTSIITTVVIDPALVANAKL